MSLLSHRGFGWAVLLSELSHVFCCVLPTLFTLFSFAANVGLVGEAPGFLMRLHEQMHHYEIPLIVFSGGMVAIGWAVFLLGRNFILEGEGQNCSETACRKQKCHNYNILVLATLLFVLNVGIFAFVHKNVLNLSAFTPRSPRAYEDRGERLHETH